MKIVYLLALIFTALPTLYFLHSNAAAESVMATRIEVDDQAGVIRFYVKGQEQALLDTAGLHVHGDINFTGVMTDYGEAGFQSLMDKTAEGTIEE